MAIRLEVAVGDRSFIIVNGHQEDATVPGTAEVEFIVWHRWSPSLDLTEGVTRHPDLMHRPVEHASEVSRPALGRDG